MALGYDSKFPKVTATWRVQSISPPTHPSGTATWTLGLECGHEEPWPLGSLPPLEAACSRCASRAYSTLKQPFPLSTEPEPEAPDEVVEAPDGAPTPTEDVPF